MLPVTRFGNGICSQSARAVKYVKQICSIFSDTSLVAYQVNAHKKALKGKYRQTTYQ